MSAALRLIGFAFKFAPGLLIIPVGLLGGLDQLATKGFGLMMTQIFWWVFITMISDLLGLRSGVVQPRDGAEHFAIADDFLDDLSDIGLDSAGFVTKYAGAFAFDED